MATLKRMRTASGRVEEKVNLLYTTPSWEA